MLLSPVSIEELKALYIETIAPLNRPYNDAEFEEFMKGIGMEFTTKLTDSIARFVTYKQAEDLKNRKWQDPSAPIGVSTAKSVKRPASSRVVPGNWDLTDSGASSSSEGWDSKEEVGWRS